jgi:hypothetical protein
MKDERMAESVKMLMERKLDQGGKYNGETSTEEGNGKTGGEKDGG